MEKIAIGHSQKQKKRGGNCLHPLLGVTPAGFKPATF